MIVCLLGVKYGWVDRISAYLGELLTSPSAELLCVRHSGERPWSYIRFPGGCIRCDILATFTSKNAAAWQLYISRDCCNIRNEGKDRQSAKHGLVNFSCRILALGREDSSFGLISACLISAQQTWHGTSSSWQGLINWLNLGALLLPSGVFGTGGFQYDIQNLTTVVSGNQMSCCSNVIWRVCSNSVVAWVW